MGSGRDGCFAARGPGSCGGGGVKVVVFPVPGLTRDLWPSFVPWLAQSPGSSPGRNIHIFNLVAPNWNDGAFRLYHGLPTLRRYLYWPNGKPFHAGRGAPGRSVSAYGEIQNSHFGLVRTARRFRGQFAARTRDKALAAHLEKYADSKAQSKLAGCYRTYSDLGLSRPGLEPGPFTVRRAVVGKRSRVKPGTGLSTNFRSIP